MYVRLSHQLIYFLCGSVRAFEHHETDGTEDEQGGQLKQIVYNKLFLSLTLALSGLCEKAPLPPTDSHRPSRELLPW
jgi:hypothetical protein